MMRWHICFLIAATMWIAPIANASAGADGSERLALGMTGREVALIMGQPNVVTLERNGVVCLVYQRYESRFAALVFVRDALIVALRHGALVANEPARSSEIGAHCSRIASAWDPSPGHPIACYRKFWLGCP
jgi:hypothetical protein